MCPQPSAGVVLLVEDPLICTFIRKVLARYNFQCVEAELQPAIALLQAGNVDVSLLVTNHPEPFLHFADRLPLLYVAAYPDPSLASRFRACRALHKPFHPEQLVAAVTGLAKP